MYNMDWTSCACTILHFRNLGGNKNFNKLPRGSAAVYQRDQWEKWLGQQNICLPSIQKIWLLHEEKRLAVLATGLLMQITYKLVLLSNQIFSCPNKTFCWINKRGCLGELILCWDIKKGVCFISTILFLIQQIPLLYVSQPNSRSFNKSFFRI